MHKDIDELQEYIDQVSCNNKLFEEKNFLARAEVIDYLDFHVIGRLEALLLNGEASIEINALINLANQLKTKLEQTDTNLFEKLRALTRNSAHEGLNFEKLIDHYYSFLSDDDKPADEIGYDNLDILINGLLSVQPIPAQTTDLEPEMVFYQKTPARIIFELIKKVEISPDDVFYDIGSGLGQVVILMGLLTDIKAKGIEFEPAFCDYANACAKYFNLDEVTFQHADARQVNYSDGTIFFMFTPFRAEIMNTVLEILRKESLTRRIKIITYGPCTAHVASKTWLASYLLPGDNTYRLCIFTSL